MFVQPPGGSVIPIVAAAGYEPFGPLKALMMGNWIEEWRAFDRRYSPTAITATDGKSLPPVLDWAYTVDPAGNVTAIEDLLKAENNRSFGYEDFNYFLTTGNGPWGTRSWTYDAIGNRLSETRDGAGSTYSYVLNPAAQNTPRLQTISGAETATYLYDAVGNVDVESVPDPVDFTWNRASNLVGISDSSQLVYDGRGYLRSAARPGFAKASFETDLTYSTAGRLLAYESTEEEIQRKYKVVYLAGRPVAVVRVDVASQDVITHYYTTDHLGTPILVTDSAANVHWQGGLEPFGENDANVLKFDVRLGFPGQYADLAWERDRPVLRYNVHRWYEPQTGRYTRVDPLRRQRDPNPFVYVRSRPTFFVDPLGLVTSQKDCKCCSEFEKFLEKKASEEFTWNNWTDYAWTPAKTFGGGSCLGAASQLQGDLEQIIQPKCWVSSVQLTKKLDLQVCGTYVWVHYVVKYSPCDEKGEDWYFDGYTGPKTGPLDPGDAIDEP